MRQMSIFLVTAFALLPFLLQAQTKADGLQMIYMQQYPKAEAILQKVVEQTPADLEAQLFLSSALAAQDKKSAAKAVLQKINSEEALGWVAKARLQMLDGNAESKITMAKAVKMARQKEPTIMAHAGESYTYFSKDAHQGISLLETAKGANSKNVRVLMALAQAYMAKREFGEALTNVEYASKQEPNNLTPYFVIGDVYQGSKNFALFEENMQKVLNLNPNFTPALLRLGDYFYNNRKWEKAKEYYDRYLAIEKNPTIEDRMQYANILFLTKDYDKVIPTVEEILKIDGSRVYLRRLIGYSYYEKGDNVKALTYMQEFFQKVTPDKVLATDYEYYGHVLGKNGQDSMAAVQYEQAIVLDSSKTELYAKIADAKFKQKDYVNAAKYFKLHIESNDKVTAGDYFNLGRAYYQLKDWVQADSAFSNIIRIRPDAITGHLWRAKTNKNLEPNVDSTAEEVVLATYGIAKPHYDKFIELVEVSPDVAKYKKDMIDAYHYLAYYFYAIKPDNPTAKIYCEKTLALDPNDVYALELIKLL